jgi:hypothetical protein
MEITYKDINFNITVESQYVEIIGDMVFEMPTDYFLKYWLEHDKKIPYFDLEASDYNPIIDEELELHSPDPFIAFMNWLMDDMDEYDGTRFNVTVQHIHWFFHDMGHAIHDCSGGEIYVNSDSERDRLLFGLDECNRLDYNLPEYHELEEIESAFRDRFNSSLSLDDYKNFEEEEYVY